MGPLLRTTSTMAAASMQEPFWSIQMSVYLATSLDHYLPGR